MNGRWNTIAWETPPAPTRRVPLSGKRPCRAWSRVVLPAPLLPTRATNSPRRTCTSTAFSAARAPNRTETPARLSSGPESLIARRS
jgi:hypothetical protein